MVDHRGDPAADTGRDRAAPAVGFGLGIVWVGVTLASFGWVPWEGAFALTALALLLLALAVLPTYPDSLRHERAALHRRRQALLRALEERQLQLDALNRARAAQFAAAGHDLRQPVHALGVLAELMDPADPDSVARRLPGVHSCIQSVSEMLAQLLDLEQLERGTYTPAVRPVALHCLLDEVEASLQACAQRKGLVLRVDAEPLWVMSDARLLRRMLFNLVTNAIKFTARGGVRVCFRSLRGRVRLTVTDTGVGIAPDRLHEVFREWVSLQPGTAGEGDGLGLGLSIVAKAADLLGHRVDLESTEGCGTRFTLELGPGVPACSRLAQPRPQPVPLPNAVVAVVENEPLVLQSLLDSLGGWGCRPVGALGLAQLADQLDCAGGLPSLLLCDLHLGAGADGLEVIRRLRARFGEPRLAAILLTADLDPALEQHACEQGICLVHKPLSPARLRRLVGKALIDKAV